MRFPAKSRWTLLTIKWFQTKMNTFMSIRSPFLVKVEGHLWHWKGFRPRWLFSCCLRLSFRVKEQGHFWHRKGFQPRWVSSWSIRWDFRVKVDDHDWHEKGFMPSWFFSCVFRLLLWAKEDGHNWHGKANAIPTPQVHSVSGQLVNYLTVEDRIRQNNTVLTMAIWQLQVSSLVFVCVKECYICLCST